MPTIRRLSTEICRGSGGIPMKWRGACATSVIAASAMLGPVGVAKADGYAAPRVVYERPANWTGIYGGLDAGWMWTNSDWAFSPPIPGAARPHGDEVLQPDLPVAAWIIASNTSTSRWIPSGTAPAPLKGRVWVPQGPSWIEIS